ncbi:sterol carrier protein [Halococcus morrhuae DSM 1307]|uniref:Sterol carrier protein n=3 Tax=Halococcus TaxID=2249 RepID=M0MDY4_HALMO|nr:SCP2 sterol-binding domain-containing protein [Halococcus dombrowskii]EMA43513.1 sterol carrier protein [Halococcus morrhuae DSM 1307]UOO97475.1 SCP2 sterol-binding domain-containing protein [Halococcus dombrowskii]
MAIKLPSEADDWIGTWHEQLNDNEDFERAASGWGVEFNGAFLFEIQPDNAYDGEPLYFFVDLIDGKCTRARQIDTPTSENFGFRYYGPATHWKHLIRGDVNAAEGRRKEKFELDGDIQKVLQYSEAIQVMTENARYIDTKFEY